MTAPYLITTKPKPQLCPRCHELTLTGHSEGISYSVDAEPVSYAGEVAAVLDGISTWELIGTTGAALIHRDHHRMRANADQVTVLVTHTCTRRIPIQHRNPIKPGIRPATVCDCAGGGHYCDPPF